MNKAKAPWMGDTEADRALDSANAAELAAILVPGQLVYTEPCTHEPHAHGWFDARRGQAPGFAELQTRLAERGLELVPAAPFYWAVRAAGQATEQADQAGEQRVTSEAGRHAMRSFNRPRRNSWRLGTTASDATTMRYRGQGHRGAPPTAELDDIETLFVIRELEATRDQLAAAHQIEGDRRARREALATAAGTLLLARRALDELLTRVCRHAKVKLSDDE